MILPLLNYLEQGNPEQATIVFLHGFGMGHRMWQPQWVMLNEQFHLLAPDLPGFAGSVPCGPFTMTRAASTVIDLLQAVCQKPVHLCGLSLGAMVALQVVLDAPDRVASLMLSGAQVQPPSFLLGAQRLLMSLVPEKHLLASFSDFVPKEHEDLLEAAREDGQSIGKRGLLHVMHEVGQVQFRQDLGRITVPTLVLCGKKDTWNLKAAQELAHGVLGATLHIIPEAGHVWNLEMPDLFNHMIREFVQHVEDNRRRK
jgi:3-oxoadipate enol-lactonase